MSNSDFRKKIIVGPDTSYANYKKVTNLTEKEWTTFGMEGAGMRTYAHMKFRTGNGEKINSSVGSVVDIPMMRVEEMYFIEAEAAAHLNDADGLALINSFMKNYRDPNYSTAVVGDSLINEIVLQKRIELWGEGLTFYDVKRLDMSVTRGYAGTNFEEAKRLNTTGRPAWMNICIVTTEKNNNEALVGYENPDPTGCYEAWSE
jgi:hypothetical protein